MKMNNVVKILMNRDGMSINDARALVEETREEINDAVSNGGGYDEIEDIIAGNLGLEMDYIFDLL